MLSGQCQQKSNSPLQLLSFSLLQPPRNVLLQNSPSLCWWQEHGGFLSFNSYFLKLSCSKSTSKFLLFFKNETVIPDPSHSSRPRHQSCKGNWSLQLQQTLLANAAEVLLYSSVPFKCITINNSKFSHGKIKPLKWPCNQYTCCYWNVRKCV